MKTVLGIDLGTQAIKVLFYDPLQQATVACESAPLDLYQNDEGAAEQQSQWWLDALQEALRKVPDYVKRSTVAISVSGQQHGFVPLGNDGEVLAPVKLWCDTSTTQECSELMQAVGGRERCIELSGNPILPGYTASKILHFRKHQRQLYDRMTTILLPHDYLNYWLTGEITMEMGDASGTGLLDVGRRRWSDALIKALDPERDLSECLPSLRQHNDIIGQVHQTAAEKTGLPAGTPVAIGGGDNMMGAIGTGNIKAGKITVSLGTSGTVYSYSDQPIIDPNGDIAAFCSSNGGWLPLLCTMNCTVTTELMRNMLSVGIEDFDACVEQAPLGSNGALTLPFFNGERTPNLPRAKGCILGLDSDNMTRQHLLRSGVEGATFALKYGIEALESLGVTAKEMVITGGGTNSKMWRQIVADIFGLEVNVMEQDEGAAFGAALQAFCAIEGISGTDEADFLSGHYAFNESLYSAPNKAAHARYQEIYQTYTEAVNNISGLYQ